MTPLVKLAVVPKSGEEASFFTKLTCLSSSKIGLSVFLHSSRKTAVSCVYYLAPINFL